MANFLHEQRRSAHLLSPKALSIGGRGRKNRGDEEDAGARETVLPGDVLAASRRYDSDPRGRSPSQIPEPDPRAARKLARDAPLNHVPVGRIGTGSHRRMQDGAWRVVEKREIDKRFAGHHAGDFGDALKRPLSRHSPRWPSIHFGLERLPQGKREARTQTGP